MRLKGILILLSIYYSLPGMPLSAQPASDCSSHIEQARAFIDQSEYEAALPLLNSCLLDDTIADALRIEANILLARAGIGLGDNTGAIAAFKDVFRISPLYELDENEDTATHEIFNQARLEFFSGDKSESQDASKDWPWIALAGGVAATLVVLMF